MLDCMARRHPVAVAMDRQGCGVLVDRKPGRQAWPGTAQERPDTYLLHAGQIGRRERRLADGFATAPSRAAPQDAAVTQALGLGRPTLSESESKQLG
jgi:hypothetical protein